MTFLLSSKALEREHPDLPEDVELQYRRWKVDDPLTCIVRVCGSPFVIRPAKRRTITYLDSIAVGYIDFDNPLPDPSNSPISGNRGWWHLSGFNGLDHPTRVTVYPKPRLVEAQNVLLWESVLYPDYETLRRSPNAVVMACIEAIYIVSGHGREPELLSQYQELSSTPQAQAVIQICTVFPGLTPEVMESWTQERFIQILCLAQSVLMQQAPQPGPGIRPPNSFQVQEEKVARSKGSNKWAMDPGQESLSSVQPVDLANQQGFNWEDEAMKMQGL